VLMKKIVIIAGLFFGIASILSAQNTFPELTGKTLNNNQIKIPLQTNGKYSLIGIAYSKKAEDDLKTWYQPVYSAFIDQGGQGIFPTDTYDINIYFIPMITGIAQGASGKIEEKMKENIDKELQPYILIYEGDIKNYRTSLKMTEKDQPYFFVLDQNGKVIYSCQGAYSKSKFEKVLEIVDEF
jgi:hypothetical protein